MINGNLTVSIIKKVMACKNCKKNAQSVVKQLKNIVKGKKPNGETKTPCQTKRDDEQEWLNESPKGKKLKAFSKPNRLESLLLISLAWVPLIVGYISIVRFILGLF